MRVIPVAVLLLLGLLAGPATAQSQAPSGTVDVIEVSGLIDRTVAGFISDTITDANSRGSEVVVVRLDTPGGLGAPLRALLDQIRTSRVPVAVWVGPPGARATGAGFWIAENAHVLALAPATALGVAQPVDLREPPSTSAEPPSTRSGRHPAFAAEAAAGKVVVAVPEGETGVAVPADAALPPGADRAQVETLDGAALTDRQIADFVAGSLPQVLTRLDGRQVQLSTGTVTLDVDPSEAKVRFVNMGLLARILHTVANPTLVYLLVIGGALALLFEAFQPGFGVAGVSGLVVLALGVYGLVVLPTGWAGVALLALGLLLLAADLALARLGLLTAAGTVALAAGSWLAFPGPALLRPSPWLVAVVVVFCVMFFVVIMTVVLRAQGLQSSLGAGAQSVVGSVGVVRSVLNPEGHVFVRGALWRARAPSAAGKVRTGSTVRVLGVNDQLTLDVEVVPTAKDS
ncbi:MAG: NfeD family protein [Egibacteraceae bacterium]